MRKHSKLTALLLAAITALSLTIPAFAAESGYTDVPDWAKEYVETVTELGLIDGKTAATFGANDPMTRADLVLALYRLANSPANEKDAKSPFKDVADDATYQDAVSWAYANNIISGRTADTFDPNGSAQRQEIAKIVNEFAARQVGKDSLTSRQDEMSAYPDASDVADWAKDYMNWAAASGFITGSNGKLLPRGTATRAEVSAILCRYMEDVSTGDASKDDPRNQNDIGRSELLVVSFGTSYNDNRVATIGAIENALEEAFPDYSVRRGFTANIIIEHVYRRDGEIIDDVTDALNRARLNGVENLLVQPTHLMNGYEYGDLVKELEKYVEDFKSIKIGAPLLTSDEDFSTVALAMAAAAEDLVKDGKTAVCYMGHGTAADSNSVYSRMQEELLAAGYDNCFVGTVESTPTAGDLAGIVKDAGYTKVVLRPMMIVAGDHANNDMAGDGEDSWKSIFEAAGFEVECDVSGLGSLEAVQQLLVAHAKDAKELGSTGITVQPNPGEAAAELADGTYAIDVECEQSMFKIDSCILIVKDGNMTAELTLGSESFDQMFVGAASAAKLATDGIVNGDVTGGKTTFTLTVEALGEALSFAAHSVKNDTWYDRTLTFVSASAMAK